MMNNYLIKSIFPAYNMNSTTYGKCDSQNAVSKSSSSNKGLSFGAILNQKLKEINNK